MSSPENIHQLISFTSFWQLGYQGIVPIIPHNAEIDENSSLHTRPWARGKVPGVRKRNGKWVSFPWQKCWPTVEELAEWQDWGSALGLKTGKQPGSDYSIVAIDADAYDIKDATIIRAQIEAQLGESPVRIGQDPKAMYIFRVKGEYPYTRIDFGAHDPKDPKAQRVEILSDGRQFVAQGIHAKTKQPYTWPVPLVAFDRLPVATPEQLDALLTSLIPLLPEARPLKRSSRSGGKNQELLRSTPEKVRDLVAKTRNTQKHFGDRDSWITYGIAVKASLEDQDEAFDIWDDWCERWEGGTNDTDFCHNEWMRMPATDFEIGVNWLCSKRDEVLGLDPFTTQTEMLYFDKEPEYVKPEPDPWSAAERIEAAKNQFDFSPFIWQDPATIPCREWLYGRQYIRKFVSTTVAPGGTGKSMLAIVEALAMVTGRDLLGVKPTGKLRVYYWNGEDPADELKRRITATMLYYGITPEDIGDRLFVDSGREKPLIIARGSRDQCIINEPLVINVVGTIRRLNIDVFIVDPFISSHEVTENDNNAIDRVAKTWAKIADATGCAVDLVHHVRKTTAGEEITVEDGRGASALLAAARAGRVLNSMSEKERDAKGADSRTGIFRIGVGKANLAPRSDQEDWYKLVSVDLGNGSGGRPSDHIGVVTQWIPTAFAAQIPDDTLARAYAACQGHQWRENVQADDWIGKPIATVLGLDIGSGKATERQTFQNINRGKIRTLVSDWLAIGALRQIKGVDKRRHEIMTIEVVKPEGFDSWLDVPEASSEPGLFD